MLACDDGVIQHEVVECLIGVLEVELNHFDAVSKRVKRHLGALSDSNVLLFVLLDTVTRVQSQRTQVSRQRLLIFQVDGAEATHLHIEELGCVEHRLLLLS